MQDSIIQWLLEGDISIQYQTYRDLLGENRPDLQKRIENEGWGARYLAERLPNKHWGQKFYFPKWTSSHYTLLDLKNLSINPKQEQIIETVNMIANEEKGPDGGILPIGDTKVSDLCINGMFLNYATYFGIDEKKVESVVDNILELKMIDGGWNCRVNRSGAVHSSLHTTISVLEGIAEYIKNGYRYRRDDLSDARDSATEFILMHQLFKSDHTGEIIHIDFLKLPYPSRWKYDILRALDYFQYSKTPWDDRMQPAIDILIQKRNRYGTWNVQAKHPGQVHFEMEKAGKPSRWNTLRASRVLKNYGENFLTTVGTKKLHKLTAS